MTDPYIIHEEDGPSPEQVAVFRRMAVETAHCRTDERAAFHIALAVRSDYPELTRIAAGYGVNVIEDAEAQAADALDELQQLRVKARRLREINDSLVCLLDNLNKVRPLPPVV